VQTLDVAEGEGDKRSVLDVMRANLLADSSQADLAFPRWWLIDSVRIGPAPNAGTPLASLSASGIGMLALPDFRVDVEALRNWTRTQLRSAHRFTRLLANRPESTITRAAWPDFQAKPGEIFPRRR
jgi:hypothetical protein